MSADKSDEPKSPDFGDPNLSLREKWRLHREHKRKTGTNPLPSPMYLNRYGPPGLLLFSLGAVGWGSAVAMPTLYVSKDWEAWLLPGRIFLTFMLVEVVVNWCLTRWVSSEYKPAIHGTKPEGFPARPDLYSGTGDSHNSSLLSVAEENGCTPSNVKVLPSHDADTTCGRRNNVAANDTSATTDNADSDSKIGNEQVDLEYPPPNPAKSGSYNGLSYRMLVATSLPDSDGHVERKPYPYWSWVPCALCQRLRPPRCHHCILCRQCVLKRDHHCYMTGACIGANNQRFFLVFLFWAMLTTIFGTAHMLPYTFYHVIPDYNVYLYDFIPPAVITRAILGYVSPIIVMLCVIFWLLIMFTLWSVGMLLSNLDFLRQGRTSFEQENSIKVTDTRSLGGKLRSVFGNYWWVNVLVPTYPWIKPHEDPVLWPHIKPF